MSDKIELSIKEKQQLILLIMKDIDKFCRDNNIPYTLSCGTLLGAVRHGGFIPWDDDADIFMLREDFDRFVKIYKSDKYNLIYNSNPDKLVIASGIAKVGDISTWSTDSTGALDFGVWVDIFPLESVPEDPKERQKFIHSILSVNNRIYHRRRHDLISIIKSYRHSFSWWLNKLDGLVHNNPYTDSSLVACAVGARNGRIVFPKKWFENLSEIRFEDHDFLAFSDTDSYLKIDYGPDYMTPRKWSHNVKVYKKDE